VGKRIYLPKLLSGEIVVGESIEIVSMRDYGGVIAVDDSVYELKKGDRVEVEVSELPLEVIVL